MRELSKLGYLFRIGHTAVLLQYLQFALGLVVAALSLYLWGISHLVSSVLIGFACGGFIIYAIQVTDVFSSAPPRRKYHLQPSTLEARRDPRQPRDTPNPGRRDLEANIAALACLAPDTIQFPWSVVPIFAQEMEAAREWMDAKCVTRAFALSTDPDLVTSAMGFIPDVIWHCRIEDVPLKCLYDYLVNCFDLSGSGPAIIPGSRDVAYLSARAFAHIELQRRCITEYGGDTRDEWKDIFKEHSPLSPADCGSDSDLKTVLFMVDMTFGYDGGFPWEQVRITPPHYAWMSHAFLYRAWHEGRLSKVVTDFVESSMSYKSPSDIVITDCFFIIGLMIGIPLHINDVTVRDKGSVFFFFRIPPTESPTQRREEDHPQEGLQGPLTDLLLQIYANAVGPPRAPTHTPARSSGHLQGQLQTV